MAYSAYWRYRMEEIVPVNVDVVNAPDIKMYPWPFPHRADASSLDSLTALYHFASTPP